MDAARCAKRMGAEDVYIVYRRNMDELPARKEEIEHAIEEGIIFKTLTNLVEVLGDEKGYVSGLDVLKWNWASLTKREGVDWWKLRIANFI